MEGTLLTWLVFLPLMGAGAVLLLPSSFNSGFRYISAGATLFTLLLAIRLLMDVSLEGEEAIGVTAGQTFAFEQDLEWIRLSMGSLGVFEIRYHIGIDGLNSLLVVLAALVLFIGAISSFEIKVNQKGYHALYLLLATSVLGCFVALDFFLFYLFFEFMLLPMYFLIGIWGGVRREYAAIKFFIYTLIGSVLILVVMVGLYISVIDPYSTAVQAGLAAEREAVTAEMVVQIQAGLQNGSLSPGVLVKTFSLTAMTDIGNYLPDSILFPAVNAVQIWGMPVRLAFFLLLMIGFAVKLPAVPVHTWLPDAHVEAPTPISVLLAGLLLKLGGYGMLRIAYPIFPDGAVYFSWWIGFFGVLAIVYAGFVALGQTQLKRLIAYSSVSHMGFVLLGFAAITTEGASGALYQMVSHGIISPMLFLVGGVLYLRTKNLEINAYKGIMSAMPFYGGLTVVAFFASLGLPGFSGFVAELLVLLGAFKSESVNQMVPRWMPVAATIGLVVGAAYYLWTLQRMYLGAFWSRKYIKQEELPDVDFREKFMLLSLGAISLGMGIFPGVLLDLTSQSIAHWVDFVQQQGTFYLELMQLAK